MKIGEKIKILRTNHKMTMQNLADKSNLTKGYISMLEKGENPQTKKEIVPSLETVQNLSKAFGMGLEEFLEGTDSSIELPKIKDSILSIYNSLSLPRQHKVYTYAEHQLDEQNNQINETFNVYNFEEVAKRSRSGQFYGSASAGTGEILQDEHNEEIEIPLDAPDHDYILKVNGNSMEPALQDGEYIYIKKTEEARSGQIVIAQLNGEAYVKKLYIDESGIRLISLNEEYKDILIHEYDKLNIVGIVIL